MEDVEESVKTTLDFLCIVRSNCDSRRLVLEQLLEAEFLNFSDKWEKSALEVKHKSTEMEVKEHSANGLEAIKAESKHPSAEPEVEELVQADILLNRAKNLRENFKLHSISDEESPAVQCQSNHQLFTTAKQRTKFAEFAAVNGVCSSKSEPVLSHITHPEHSSIRASLKNSCHTELVKKTSANKLSVTGQRTFRSQSVSVVTKKELTAYKHLQCNTAQIRTNLKLNSSLSGVRGKKIENGRSSACKKSMCVKMNDNMQVDKRRKPTMKDFRCAIKTNALENMTLKPNLFHCLWYPFLSSSNAMCLSLQLTCSSYEELQHVYTLYHQIQEILYWLDLYSIVGKALHAQPADCHNQSFHLIRSYLRSLFHENMQRTPIILPPDAS